MFSGRDQIARYFENLQGTFVPSVTLKTEPIDIYLRMGVTGLLQHLKEIQEPSNLANYRGMVLAVDTYGWLHRGLISCAQELCQDLPTKRYVNSVMKKVDMLLHFGVEPYLVFDGAYLPTKAETAKDRRQKREEAQLKANEYIKKGNRKLAWKEFMKAAGVTPEMAKSIMVELDRRNVRYVVAPYEADPQMVYLEKIGLVHGILSEDSDLLVFGCKRLITKLNDFGECIEINRANFCKVKKIPHFSKYTSEQLRLVAMLSGCDYTKGIPGVGLKTAFTLVQRHQNSERLLNALIADGKSISAEFQDEIRKADLAFQFQKVFNPKTQELDTLNPYPNNFEEDFEFLELCCGKTLSKELHFKICNGSIHPNSHKVLISREQSITSLKSQSMSACTFEAASLGKEIDAKRSITKSIDSYFQVAAQPKLSRHHSTPFLEKESVIKVSEPLSPSRKKMKTLNNRNIALSNSLNEKEMHKSKFFSRLTQPRRIKQDDINDAILNENLGTVKSALAVSELKGVTINTTEEEIIADTSDDEATSFSVNSKLVEPFCESIEFGVDPNYDEIQESPLKKAKEDKLQSVALELRKKFLMEPNVTSQKGHTYKRIPLAAKDTNKSSISERFASNRESQMNMNKNSIVTPGMAVQFDPRSKLRAFEFQR